MNCISREISEWRFWQNGMRMCQIKGRKIMNGKKRRTRRLKENTERWIILRKRIRRIMTLLWTTRSILLRAICWVRQRRLISFKLIRMRVRARVRHLMMSVATAAAVQMIQAIHRAVKFQNQKRPNSKPRNKPRSPPFRLSNNPCQFSNTARNC